MLPMVFGKFGSNQNGKIESAPTLPARQDGATAGVKQMEAIRDHWHQLGSRVQTEVVTELFLYVFRQYPHMRPLWPFGRARVDNPEALRDSSVFRHHVVQVQSALSLLCNNVDNPRRLCSVLEDVGSHHFFYDAYEPHLEVIQEALIVSFRKQASKGNGVGLDPRVEEAWTQAWQFVSQCIGHGMKEQRKRYLSQCVTQPEVAAVRAQWALVKEHGMVDAGLSLCGGALRAYDALSKQCELDYPVSIDTDSDDFRQFATDTIKALDTAIGSFEENGCAGFATLPDKLKPYVGTYVIIEVCPSLVRKAFMEGLINMLTYVLGEASMTDEMQRTWFKIYRILEQSIITNIVDF